MITNADITIYNHKYNKNTRLDDWIRTVIRGVHFYEDNKVAVGDKGLNGAKLCKIRIPGDVECDRSYISDDEYFAAADVSQYWTLQDGDIVVRGVCNIEIEKPADLKSLHVKYYKINSWADNRFGGQPHWRIGGE